MVFFSFPRAGVGNEVTQRSGDHALATRQRRVIDRDWTLARPEWVSTPARGNQNNIPHYRACH